MIVVDASVAVKWWMPEEDGREAALAILESSERLLAPCVMQVEVTNAIIRHYREGRATEAKAREAEALWQRGLSDGLVEFRPWQQLVVKATELAISIRHTVVDCMYVMLAMEKDAVLITADGTLARRAIGVHPKIRLLTDGFAHTAH